MKVLVTGTQFANKGAQSLLFSLINELKIKYKDVDVYYLPVDNFADYNKADYKFNIIYNGEQAHKYEQGGFERFKVCFKYLAKKILNKPTPSFKNIKMLHNTLPQIDILIDLSGYQLSSQWPINTNKKFLRYFKEAFKYNIPVVAMPQSFGPFNYGNNQAEMDTLIKETLSKVKVIYAREQEGYDLLKKKYGLNNVKLACDFVLQSAEPEIENIFNKKPINEIPQIAGTNNVGIIPNFQNFVHGNEKQIMTIYKNIIDELLVLNKNVIIFRHSKDLEPCRKIYNMYKNNDNVSLIEKDFSCFEYNDFVKKFDYVIAARYHAIVHAYKSKIPAVVLGWAVKYKELTKLFSQTDYEINTNAIYSKENLKAVIDKMELNYKEEKNVLNKKLNEISTDSSLDYVISEFSSGKFVV